MERYEPEKIEAKWQAIWAENRAFNVPNPTPGEQLEQKTYVLEMLPYPSGELHVGHVRNYMLGEVVAHFRRRRGEACSYQWGSTCSGCRPRTRRSRPDGIPQRSARSTSRRSGTRWSGSAG